MCTYKMHNLNNKQTTTTTITKKKRWKKRAFFLTSVAFPSSIPTNLADSMFAPLNICIDLDEAEAMVSPLSPLESSITFRFNFHLFFYFIFFIVGGAYWLINEHICFNPIKRPSFLFKLIKNEGVLWVNRWHICLLTWP
jgi:hypothetical protein